MHAPCSWRTNDAGFITGVGHPDPYRVRCKNVTTRPHFLGYSFPSLQVELMNSRSMS
jgi:hypothetical protein